VPADGPGPAEHAELADSLSTAFLVLLEALSPVERAVFMLREVFGYGYPDVARITGDMDALLDMLAPDVVLHSDGGGKAQAVGKLAGRQHVMRLLVGLLRRVRALGISLRLAWVNGQPGAVMYDAAGRVISVIELDMADGAVQAIYGVVNPDKLAHLGPVSDLARRPERGPAL
jgi:Sigma-70, region 4